MGTGTGTGTGTAHHICCTSTPLQIDDQAEPKKTTGAACICCIGNKHQPRARRGKYFCSTVRTPRRGQPSSPRQAKMAKPRRWFRVVRRSFAYTSCRSVSVEEGGGRGGEVKVYNPRMVEAPEVVDPKEGGGGGGGLNDEYSVLCKEGFSREDVAAVTIQAYFRGHLARRAYKALKSLVRLQAVARGAYVRKQAEVAIHCMQALVRLQVRVRARQLLTKSKEVKLLQTKETGSTFLETYAAKNPVEVTRA